MAIIAVALSVGLYFGLQDDSGSGKNSTETTNDEILGDLNQVLPPEDENDTKADEKDDGKSESIDKNESKDENAPDAADSEYG